MPGGCFKEKYNFPSFQRVQHFPGGGGGGVQLFPGGGGVQLFPGGEVGGGGFQVLIS